MPITVAALISTLLLALAAGGAQPAPTLATAAVPCRDIIGRVGSGRLGGYRVVLGVVSVPAAYLPQIVESRDPRWPYWRKAGLVVRAGAPPVTVTVPRRWRSRVSIGWGNSDDAGSAVRIASCRQHGSKPWNAYAGGFSLRVAAACVPLVITVGARSTVVRFGLGRRC